MKISNIYKVCMLMLAGLQTTACSEEKIVDFEQGVLEPLVINATPKITRTALAEDGKSIHWQKGDKIAVYDYTAPKHEFAIESFDKSKARFLGKITAKKENFLVLYPHHLAADNLAADNKISVSLPTEQTASANTFASGLNISASKGKRNVDGSPSVLTFHNVCQLLKFEVPGYASDKISKIVFTTNTAVAGALTVDCTGETPIATISADGSKTISILPPAGTSTFVAGTYYIVSAPVQMNGFSMSFTCGGTQLSLRSNSTFGGEAGKIYSLGQIDLVETPNAKTEHVYKDGVLMGTKLTLNNAPIKDKQWSAVVKNASGTTVRTLQGTGNLISAEDDAIWPYLPTGMYTADYSFTNSNNKEFTKSISFNISEKPNFSISNYAYTSFSYYKGDGVEQNIETANGLDNMMIYEPRITINGISLDILNNSNYSFVPESNVTSGIISKKDGIIRYNSYKVNSLTSYRLTAEVTFDGTSKSSEKTVYITGLPYSVAPPTQTDWTGSAKSWTDSYVRLHKHTIEKTFYCPENINVKVGHSVRLYRSRIAGKPTYKLQCSGTDLASFTAETGGKAVTDNGEYDGVLSASSPIITCTNSAGTDDGRLTGEGSNTQVKSISVEYR